MTLIEISVILLVMIALAGVLLPYFTNLGGMAQCEATDATMASIRDSIMGNAGRPGYLSDMGRMPDSALNDLFNNPSNNSATRTFNPNTQRGWRGPYLAGGSTCGGLATVLNSFPNANLASSPGLQIFWNACGFLLSTSTPIAPNSGKWNQSMALDSYKVVDQNGQNPLPVRSPIRLFSTQGHYFLISGGANNAIESGICSIQTVSCSSPPPIAGCSCNDGYWACPVPMDICELNNSKWTWSLTARNNDDRIHFLDTYDPGGNQPCAD